MALESDLDGGGKFLAPLFSTALRGRKFNKAFEWCAGPAYIGLHLLDRGICGELIAGDINPEAVELVRREGRATAYCSDNMLDIPLQKFDLIVGNPPSYFNIQQSHACGFMRHDLRASDIGMKVHREFLCQIPVYMHRRTMLLISEIAPFDKEVMLFGELYDLRPREPIVDFIEMFDEAGLRLQKVFQFNKLEVPVALLQLAKY